MRDALEEATAGPGERSDLLLRRSRQLTVLLVILLGVLGGRLVQLQHFESARFQRLAARQHRIEEVLPARPGNILDASGRVLATSVLVRSLYADPKHVADPHVVAEQLGGALGFDASQLERELRGKSGRRFVWIKRRLSDAEVASVEALDLDPEAVGFRKEYRRFYPQGRLAVQLLGFRDVDGVGKGGVEGFFDATLRGHDGKRRLIRDARGRTLEVAGDSVEAPIPGKDVVLTIDAYVQNFAEQGLDELVAQWRPSGASAVVFVPQTGEVLAMASRPTLDPNAIGVHAPDAWRNRPITDVYEPGSTFKPFVLARALDMGLVHPGEMIFCENGIYRMGNRLLHDHHPFGSLSLSEVVVRSSNIGMAKIGQRLGNTNLHQAVRDFGFGRPTGIELPGEVRGRVLDLERWTSYSTGSIPMGHEMAVTPLQLVTAYGALCNEGRLLRPRLVRYDAQPTTWLEAGAAASSGAAGPPGRREHSGAAAEAVARPTRADTAAWILDPVLRNVVEDARGTGRRARMDEYVVFGKSGTAQKAAARGYSHRRHVSSFLVGGPLPEVRALVLVVVDEPQAGSQPYGGKVAAPTAAKILEATLRYLHVGATQRSTDVTLVDRPALLERPSIPRTGGAGLD